MWSWVTDILTSRQTGRITIGRNKTLTLTVSRRKLVTARRSCEGVAGQRGQEPLNTEAEESALLGVAARQVLVKTN
jgi:hypothetical protein